MYDDSLRGPPIHGVLFDFHKTLVDQGSGNEWLQTAWRHAGRASDPASAMGADAADELATALEAIWTSARVLDPEHKRDLTPEALQAVLIATAEQMDGVDSALAAALYETFQSPWLAYEHAIPLLNELRSRGVRTALVSNIGTDIRMTLDRIGLLSLLDAVVLSFEIASAKPDPGIFAEALRRIDVPVDRALMVGDNWRDDGGAAGLGIRTLILPPRPGGKPDLAWVLRLVGEASGG